MKIKDIPDGVAFVILGNVFVKQQCKDHNCYNPIDGNFFNENSEEEVEPFPSFKHDCNNCVYLGPYFSEEEDRTMDLYVCASQDKVINTVIARFSDEGGDYCSGLLFVKIVPELREAFERAKNQGFIFKGELK